MYRYTEKKINCNVVLDLSGCGDNIAALPAVLYNLNNHPQLYQHFWVPDYFYNFAVRSLSKNKRLNICKFSEHKLNYKKHYITRALSLTQTHNSMATHLVDFAFHSLVNKQVDIEYKNYLPVNLDGISISRFNLPDKYVVITTGFTAPARELLPEHVNNISEYIISKGYVPVFLGNTGAKTGINNDVVKGNFKKTIDYSKGIKLIDQTNLLEAAAIIRDAKAIVGLDNGLIHVAATVNTPIVVGYTNVDPKLRLPIRNNILGYNCYPVTLTKEELVCVHCQSNMNFAVGHVFTECFYKDYKCLNLLTSDRYIKELEKVL
jgi:ADP-heptose:LPS heptosyltransferase